MTTAPLVLTIGEPAGVAYRVVGGAENPSELNAVRAFGDGLRAAYALAGQSAD